MAAAAFSRMDPFDCENGDLDYYLEQFNHFLVLNSLENQPEKVVPLFIGSIGQEAYRKLKEICGTVEPNTKTFEELVTLLQQYFAMREFYRCNQKPKQYLGAYINQLKQLQEKCNFGPFAKEALRDRIACGKLAEDQNQSKPTNVAVTNTVPPKKPENTGTKPKLAKEPKPQVTPEMLSLLDGLSILQQATATKNPVNSVNKKSKDLAKKTSNDKQSGNQLKCKICGHTHDAGQECPHKDASCFMCKKKGHIASVCREKNEKNKTPPVQVHVHVQQNSGIKN
ncbi:uncharacterized protein LOC129756927 [Uranotaenia lowii]|uniref:uncharacterized protein LOC129756927 n=1 Tax=Uranotaenia lowii TaxID=190385 RepID=UPI00247860A5|nr:uncharacterized protein LOC129756927 [Uranotaenia lowii]